MRRALSILLLAGACALGQSPVLIQNLLLSGAAAAASSPVNNVGQIGHSAYLSFTNAPSHTCTNAAATAQLEYSFDNSTWTAFGSPMASSTVSGGQSYIGQGGFAYIRFNLVSFDTTNCRATVWYVGTSQPLAITLSGALGIGSVTTCNMSTSVAMSSGGTGGTVIPKPSSGSIHVCGVVISMNANDNITFSYGPTTGSGCLGATGSGTGTDITTYSQSSGNSTLTVGSAALGNIFTAPAGNNLCYFSSLTAGTITAYYAIF